MLIIIHNNVSYQYKNVATKTRFSGGGTSTSSHPSKRTWVNDVFTAPLLPKVVTLNTFRMEKKGTAEWLGLRRALQDQPTAPHRHLAIRH